MSGSERVDIIRYMPAVGLDIGSSSIKLVVLSGSTKKPKLDGFGLAINPTGSLKLEMDNTKVAIAETIKELFQETGVKNKKVVVALPESKIFTRVIEIPVLSEAELASAIAWEAEQYIPVPIADVQLDYRILERPEAVTETSKMKVFLVAAPLKVVSNYVSVLEMAAVELEALETEILGLTRSLATSQEEVVMIINLGLDSTDICIACDQSILFSRSLSTGGSALSRVLANELGLESNQAEQYKRTYGLDANQLQGRVRNSLLTVFNTLVVEIKKAMHFYASKSDQKLRRVILSGGGAYLPEVTSELAKSLGLEVVVGDPFMGVEMNQVQRQRIGQIQAVFSVAMGLAKRDF